MTKTEGGASSDVCPVSTGARYPCYTAAPLAGRKCDRNWISL